MTTGTGYQMPSAEGTFEKTTIERRALEPLDVQIEIKYAGICHSDIHTARNEWGNTAYPVVPGHEIAGIVTAVGPEVTRHKVGDRVGVGCFVDSCGECEACRKGEEQYCAKGVVQTYNWPVDGEYTKGGYSTEIVVTDGLGQPRPRPVPGPARRRWHLRRTRGARASDGAVRVQPHSQSPRGGGFARRRAGRDPGDARLCAEHDTPPEIEVISADQIDEAYDRVVASDVRYRFVIDAGTM
jgi:D-arabinose 1-dehydrogenase-like Zn-dependent alcohol dehydrogenase